MKRCLRSLWRDYHLLINRGADGPAALVISEGMCPRLPAHQAADNNESAISLVQTAEGALNEVSTLLRDMRQRAVAAANTGFNDENRSMLLSRKLRMPWIPLTGSQPTLNLVAKICLMEMGK